MPSSLFNNKNINKNVEFINDHVGGKNNEKQSVFKKQIELNDFIDENTDKLKPIENKSNNQKRLNNYETEINGNSLSNNLVIPDDYKYSDFFQYILQKNLNNINSRTIVKQHQINIDSRLQNRESFNEYINLNTNPFYVKANSNILNISIPNNETHKFHIGDKILLQGLTPIKKNLSNVNFNFSNSSNIVKLSILPDFTSKSKFYDILIKFEGITNGNSNYFENIPLNTLNQIQNININSNNELFFEMPLTFYSNNINTLISNCKIYVYNISNVPINIINAYRPIGDLNLIEYHTIYNIFDNFVEIQLPITFNINQQNLSFGGSNIQIGYFAKNTLDSKYTLIYDLNKDYHNVASIKILNSVISIPSIETDNIFINSTNNKFYWKNLIDDKNIIYDITIPTGIYNYIQLQEIMNELINNTKKISNVPNLLLTNYVELNFKPQIKLFTFKSLNTFILPLCFVNLNTVNNVHIITIEQEKHNYKVGDYILIVGAIDYYTISKENINERHIITSVISQNSFQISLININPITDVGNTKGGFKTKIISNNPFQLLFNFPNTIGNILNFQNVGSSSSITPFSNYDNQFIINNTQSYLFHTVQQEIQDIPIDPNYSYFLLQEKNFNVCDNPFYPKYFYKFSFDNRSTSSLGLLQDTFVDFPITLNPPVEKLRQFEFTFVNPQGQPIDYKTFHYSLTIQIDTITTVPENTQINENIAKI